MGKFAAVANPGAGSLYDVWIFAAFATFFSASRFLAQKNLKSFLVRFRLLSIRRCQPEKFTLPASFKEVCLNATPKKPVA
jgi:hypothetical protein